MVMFAINPFTIFQWATGFFPGVKRLESGVNHPLPSRTEVKERVDLYLYSRSKPSWPVLGSTLTLPLITFHMPDCESYLLPTSVKHFKNFKFITL
jgi:hypothetical protein